MNSALLKYLCKMNGCALVNEGIMEMPYTLNTWVCKYIVHSNHCFRDKEEFYISKV